jgi:CBS domain-containing protein
VVGVSSVLIDKFVTLALDTARAGFIMPNRTHTREALMTLLELCDPEPAAVHLQSSVADAIRMMLNRHVGAVAVVDGERRVAGIFTERDVLRRLVLSSHDPEKTSVCELMTTPVELATLATGLAEAMSTMVERHYRHLPVVDDDARLLGIVSIRHILQARIDDLTQQLDSLEQYVCADGPGG